MMILIMVIIILVVKWYGLWQGGRMKRCTLQLIGKEAKRRGTSVLAHRQAVSGREPIADFLTAQAHQQRALMIDASRIWMCACELQAWPRGSPHRLARSSRLSHGAVELYSAKPRRATKEGQWVLRTPLHIRTLVFLC